MMYEIHLYAELVNGKDEDLGMVYWNTSKRQARSVAKYLNKALMPGAKAHYEVESRSITGFWEEYHISEVGV